MAVSSESMTQSAPSSTALATSVVSARVGMGLLTMESNICVATITGLLARLQAAIMRFCMVGKSGVVESGVVKIGAAANEATPGAGSAGTSGGKAGEKESGGAIADVPQAGSGLAKGETPFSIPKGSGVAVLARAVLAENTAGSGPVAGGDGETISDAGGGFPPGIPVRGDSGSLAAGSTTAGGRTWRTGSVSRTGSDEGGREPDRAKPASGSE